MRKSWSPTVCVNGRPQRMAWICSEALFQIAGMDITKVLGVYTIYRLRGCSADIEKGLSGLHKCGLFRFTLNESVREQAEAATNDI